MGRYIREGSLPALAEIARTGAQAPVISTLPATTPVAWATMATGALPSRTGIEGFLVHLPGDRLDQRVSGCFAYRCRAQTIWDTVAAAGKRSLVVKFPLSYPASTATFRLDGAAGWGGLKCLHEAASRSVASTITADATQPLRLYPTATAGSADAGLLAHGRWEIPTLWETGAVVLGVSLRRSSAGVAWVDVEDRPDGGGVLASLQQGEWSAPLTLRVPARRGMADVCFRVKVLECSDDPLRVSLFNTAFHERAGHSVPDEVWQRCIESVGPIEEQSEPSLVFEAGLDLDTQLDLFRLNTDWLKRVSEHLLMTEPWDLFMVHAHVVDWAHHLLEGGLDPRHPDFDPLQAPAFEAMMLETYRLVDDLVATVAAAAGPDANLIIVGDHGQDLVHTTFRTNEWLATQGLLRWADDGESVDWSCTQAYALGNYIHLNRLGREPTGILTAAEAANVGRAVIDGLLGLSDPATGSRPVLIAGEKAHFERLGADGAGVGDIVFCLRSGYQATNGRGELLGRTRLLREFTSGHDHFWPLDPRIQTRLYASGPDFRRGYDHDRTAHLVDIAPTVCAILGIDPPAQCEGHTLSELLTMPSGSRSAAAQVSF